MNLFDPYLKILDLANLFAADAPMKKSVQKLPVLERVKAAKLAVCAGTVSAAPSARSLWTPPASATGPTTRWVETFSYPLPFMSLLYSRSMVILSSFSHYIYISHTHPHTFSL